MFGLELLSYPLLLIVEWLIVFAINIVPAFMPPTWMTLSAFYIMLPQNIFILVFVGVTASTVGRYCLAKLSGKFVHKFASKKKREEMTVLKEKLAQKPFAKFIFTLLFALSPLPSNALFIAVGATKTRLREVVAGFFIGRTISYLFLVFTTEKVFSSIGATVEGTAALWTIMIEVIGVLAIIVFFLFDWEKFLSFGSKKRPSKKKK